jgi:hypothetical protein
MAASQDGATRARGTSVGLRLDDQGARLRLFGLERWLHDQTRIVHRALEVQGGRE